MSILSSLTGFINGSVFSEVKDIITTYLPPSMTEQERLEFELRLTKQLNEKQLEANKIINDAAAQLDRRIREQEGTASDLKSLPILGKLIIFLRGAQRPFWGFATFYIDSVWFLNEAGLNAQQEKALIIINILVLGFLFGERTLLNLEPLLVKLFGKDRV